MTGKALSQERCYVVYPIFGQLQSDIVTAVKNSTTLLFKTVDKDHDVVGLLSILYLICVKNLSGSKVDLYFEQLKILFTTLSYAQTKGISNHNFGDAVYDQVLATLS